MRILITGASGFVGTHLVEFLVKKYKRGDIFGLTYAGFGILPRFLPHDNLFELDLRKKEKLNTIVSKVRPLKIIHLASLAAVGESFKEPQVVLENNILIALNLLESVKKKSPQAKLLLIGSANEYGAVKAEQIPLSEETPLRPTSPYAVSKVAVDYLGLQYFLAHKLQVIRLRPFNHLGEGQGLGFATSDFAKQIIEVELGKRNSVKVGNLKAVRDFTDVKDIVIAYDLALDNCTPGEVYNVGSGKGVLIEDLLKLMIKKAKKKIPVAKDPKKFRPVDIKSVIADTSKFQKATGWKPSIPLESTLERVLNYWRIKLKS